MSSLMSRPTPSSAAARPRQSPRPTRSAARNGRAAWAGDPPLRRAARERLLESAARCIARDGLAATGIASVAAQAGVSRPTVYRYFANRADMIQAALLWAARGHAERTAQHLRGFSRPDEQAVEGVLFALRLVRSDPVLQKVWASASLDTNALRGFTSPLALALVRHALAGLVDSAGWDGARADEAVEVMMRFTLSLLAAPAPRRGPAALRSFLERRLLPALGLAAPVRARARLPSPRHVKE